MTSHPYLQLIRFKQWADRGLYDVAGDNIDRLDSKDATILLQILDHIHVVDCVFQRHLQGVPHEFHAPRSDRLPDLETLAGLVGKVDGWYVSHVQDMPEPGFEHPVDFVYTNGTRGRMTRGQIVLHVCLHGAYHRGNAGLVLQKNGIAPNNDRLTDFLEAAA